MKYARVNEQTQHPDDIYEINIKFAYSQRDRITSAPPFLIYELMH